MVWQQVYDPLHSPVLSTLCASLPLLVLLGGLAFFHVKAHWAALAGLVVALAISVLVFGMPAGMAARTAAWGALFGLLPIGWIVLNVIFLYQLTTDAGLFDVLQKSITGITDDRRLQLLLVAFCFGAFFEGAAGFGTPVAVTAAILMGIGFSPLAAAGLSLIANTAPVAFGALGTPVVTLAAVTGLDVNQLSSMVGRQLPFFSLLVPFWLIWAFVGFRADDGGLARDPRGRGRVRGAPVRGVEPPRTLARRRGGFGGVDGRPRGVPQALAAEDDLDQRLA